ncbi:MAG: hypothetical protein HC904_03285 [Blastochloris sp.]|nr:hypothetical protein [Blastochloris sp.]
MARWLLSRAKLWPGRGRIPVIEVGGGTGELLALVMRELGWWRRRGFSFHEVESSEPLRAEQERRLKGAGVIWHGSLEEALDWNQGEAFDFSNELVDAFPCMILGFQQGEWRELWLEQRGDEMEERWLPVEGERSGAALAELLAQGAPARNWVSGGDSVELSGVVARVADSLAGWEVVDDRLWCDGSADIPAAQAREHPGVFSTFTTGGGGDLSAGGSAGFDL